MAKKKKEPRILFSAALELERIAKDGVRYRVTSEQGMTVWDLDHITFDRQEFPEDDNFNLDFLAADLDAIKPANPDDVIDPKAVKQLKKKQGEFRRFQKLAIVITE